MVADEFKLKRNSSIFIDIVIEFINTMTEEGKGLVILVVKSNHANDI